MENRLGQLRPRRTADSRSRRSSNTGEGDRLKATDRGVPSIIQQQSTHPLMHALSTLWRYLRRAVSVACLLFAIGIVVGGLVVELAPLGSRFSFMITVAAPAATVLFLLTIRLLSTFLLGPSSRTRAMFNKGSGFLHQWVTGNGDQKLSFRRRALSAMLILCVGIASFSSFMFVERTARESDAEAALQSFEIVHGPSLEDAGVQRILAEFERARRRLDGQWPVSHSQPVALYLFRDV